jgi:UbiD family decarboxylase
LGTLQVSNQALDAGGGSPRERSKPFDVVGRADSMDAGFGEVGLDRRQRPEGISREFREVRRARAGESFGDVAWNRSGRRTNLIAEAGIERLERDRGRPLKNAVTLEPLNPRPLEPSNPSFRSFLTLLSESGRLVHLRREVDPHTEMGELIALADRERRAVVFERVRGSAMQCAANVVGDRAMLASALGVDPAGLLEAFLSRSRRRVPPVLVERGPVQEVVHLGQHADLRDLPLVVHSEKDAAPYLTAGLVIARDPETGRRNVSFNRMMLRGKGTMGIRMMPPQHLGRIYDKATARREPLEVAVAVGNHPAELVAGATSLPFGDDEFELAGALRGNALEVVRCRTVDLEVPANAEVALEGEILPGVAEPEGPYGDFMQFYIPVMANQVFRLRAITHRRNPIFQTMHAGVAEDTNLLAISREALLCAGARELGVDVVDVGLAPTILGGAISIRKASADEPARLIADAFGRYRWLKVLVVVDEDVDVHDPADVCWALATRGRIGPAITHLADGSGFPRDPHGMHRGKLGIDATIPIGTWPEHERKRPPRHGSLRLDDFRGAGPDGGS